MKSNKILNQDPEDVPIILYQDSFQVVNPIRPARKRQIISAV